VLGFPTKTATSSPSNAAQTAALPGGGADDLLLTRDGQGTYIWNSGTGVETYIATPADFVAAGDLDGDGLDDPIGVWPAYSGVWVRNSGSGQWVLMATPAAGIAAGDLSGDGKKDLFGTWAAFGTYYLDSTSGLWVQIATPATNVAAGDLDGDNIADAIGTWPAYGGVWVKFSTTGLWSLIATPAQDLAVGDMNGDGRMDLVGTWDLYGSYYRDSMTGQWVLIGTNASQVTAGRMDGDAIYDLVGVWPTLGGLLINYSTVGQSATIGASARDIAGGKFRAGGGPAPLAIQALTAELARGPAVAGARRDLADKGPGGRTFKPQVGKNLVPQMSRSTVQRIPGPGQPGFKVAKQNNVTPKKQAVNPTKKTTQPEKY
jgi:hypothetical protein